MQTVVILLVKKYVVLLLAEKRAFMTGALFCLVKGGAVVTEKLKELGKILEIELLDHIVVGNGRYVSIRQQKLVKW